MSGYLAIDFGGTRTRAGWFDTSLNLLHRDETLSFVDHPIERVIQRLIDTGRHVVPSGEHPTAIGVSAPGPLDAARGIIHHAKTLPGWEAVPLARRISEAFGNVATVMQNDANLAALAEYHQGAGQDCDPLIYLTISTGIGGGAVINGRLFTGWRGLAIEPGHIRLTLPDGSIRRLEELASGTALGQLAQQRLKQDRQDSLLRQMNPVDGKAVGMAAKEGDSLALEIAREAANYLGLGLVNLLHLFNPQAIVIGGSVSLLGDLLLDPMKAVIRANLLDPSFYDEDVIRLASLGDDVCLYGAAYYCRAHEQNDQPPGW